MLVLGIWFTVAVVTQSSDADAATANGSGPVVLFTQARIGALQMRADDELTLLTRDSVASYQPDFDMTAGRISRLLGSASNGAGSVEEGQITQRGGPRSRRTNGSTVKSGTTTSAVNFKRGRRSGLG